MTNCSNWKSKHVLFFRAIFSWVSKEIQDCFGLASLCSLIGQENPLKLMDQSEVISRTIWSRGFPALEVGFMFLLWVPIGSLWPSSVFWLAVVITLDTMVNRLKMQTSQVSIKHFSTKFRQTKIKVISKITQNIGNIRRKKTKEKSELKDSALENTSDQVTNYRIFHLIGGEEVSAKCLDKQNRWNPRLLPTYWIGNSSQLFPRLSRPEQDGAIEGAHPIHC